MKLSLICKYFIEYVENSDIINIECNSNIIHLCNAFY